MPTNALFAKVRYDSRRARPFSRLRHNLKLGFYHISDDTVVVYFKNTPQITERGYIEFDLIIKIGEEFKFLNRIFRLETLDYLSRRSISKFFQSGEQKLSYHLHSDRNSRNFEENGNTTCIPVYIFTIGCASPNVSQSARVVRIVSLGWCR